MKEKFAINISNLTKIYNLYNNSKDRLKEALNPFRKSYHKEFYALKNINLKIIKGETIGIIGHNGAGKSTLLKLITGVLTQSSGTIRINGKIASLLELGAGFNLEMSGLENIYLNGILMGFTKEEIDKKVDSIIEFADIKEFIHQPTKMYSSGMFARLAFAVAINVEPDILIVDEALSVGDIKFQLKCINKFKELQKNGVTILFVSHDVFMVRSFCTRAIWLDNGEIKEIGDVTNVTAHYNEFMYSNNKSKVTIKDNFDAINRWGEKVGMIKSVELFNKDLEPSSIFKLNEKIVIKVLASLKEVKNEKLSIAISIKDKNGIDLIVSITHEENLVIDNNQESVEVVFELDNYFINGEYVLAVSLEDRTLNTPLYLDYIEGAKYFKSEAKQTYCGIFHQPVKQFISYK